MAKVEKIPEDRLQAQSAQRTQRGAVLTTGSKRPAAARRVQAGPRSQDPKSRRAAVGAKPSALQSSRQAARTSAIAATKERNFGRRLLEAEAALLKLTGANLVSHHAHSVDDEHPTTDGVSERRGDDHCKSDAVASEAPEPSAPACAQQTFPELPAETEVPARQTLGRRAEVEAVVEAEERLLSAMIGS